jgi:hypothetical protein
VEERSEDSPGGVKLVVTDEVGVVTLEGVEDKSLVSLGDLKVRETTTVGEVELGNGSLHGQSGELGVHLDVDRLIRLDTDDELVTGDILEDSGSDVLELDTDLSLLLVEGCWWELACNTRRIE